MQLILMRVDGGLQEFRVIGANLSKPHINKVCTAHLSVCPYVHDRKIYMSSSNLPLVVDSSVYGPFGELLCMPTFNKHVVSNKTGSCTKKQV